MHVYKVKSYIEIFIKEIETFFELTEMSEKDRGIFIKAFLSVEATRKYVETKFHCDYKKHIRTTFSKPSNLGNDLNATLRYRKGGDSMMEFVRRIETLTKNILSHNLDEENLKMVLIQNTLDDHEMKKDLKMQDLKTFNEIKSRIIKCDEV